MGDTDSQAVDSKYDESPLQPPSDEESDSSDSDDVDIPDEVEDLSADVPNVGVMWESPPSWNLDPSGGDSSGSGDQSDDIPDARRFKVDAVDVRAAEETMLSESRTAVSGYTQLQQKVATEKGTVFGQGLKYWDAPGEGYSYGVPAPDPELMGSMFAGDDFAAVINPIQEQVLSEIGGLLETTGEFIAMINAAGQAYSQADRDSKFPEPPADI
ncbi:hypothetical protein [Streptomyces tsukubensis]|uniref:Uncharacterized protein n=1 Tax=Streptomyces tsukubensis TaxID=83656 RepID=A0A1V4A6N2_9ACTN|nr:hypothetical protein [Streptomyces tsukubensis]OON77027.1 hypothetical protein B1H18_20045 [Streptomyces tsukubensis]QFR93733.1 hypothetical protein GBW32_12435 [Streptomyces tsukubensis]